MGGASVITTATGATGKSRRSFFGRRRQSKQKGGGKGKSVIAGDDTVVLANGMACCETAPFQLNFAEQASTTTTEVNSDMTNDGSKTAMMAEMKRKPGILRAFGKGRKNRTKEKAAEPFKQAEATAAQENDQSKPKESKPKGKRTNLQKAKTYRNQAMLLLESISIESKLKQNMTIFKSKERFAERRDIERRAKKAYEYAAESRRLYERGNELESRKQKQVSLPKSFGRWRSGVTVSSTGALKSFEYDDKDSVGSNETTFSQRVERKYEEQKEKESKLMASTQFQTALETLNMDNGEMASFFLTEARRILDGLPDENAVDRGTTEAITGTADSSISAGDPKNETVSSGGVGFCGVCLPRQVPDAKEISSKDGNSVQASSVITPSQITKSEASSDATQKQDNATKDTAGAASVNDAVLENREAPMADKAATESKQTAQAEEKKTNGSEASSGSSFCCFCLPWQTESNDVKKSRTEETWCSKEDARKEPPTSGGWMCLTFYPEVETPANKAPIDDGSTATIQTNNKTPTVQVNNKAPTVQVNDATKEKPSYDMSKKETYPKDKILAEPLFTESDDDEDEVDLIMSSRSVESDEYTFGEDTIGDTTLGETTLGMETVETTGIAGWIRRL